MKPLKIIFAFLCYLIGFASIIYYFDFFTGFFVSKDINSGNPQSFMHAVYIDLGLIVLFGLQHTVMARTGFKDWFEKKMPPSLTRSFYILFSSMALGFLIWFWQPIPLVIYDLRGTAGGNILLGLYYLGWAVGLLSTFEIDHFKLFGLKQVFNSKEEEEAEFKTPFFYRIVRHPIYLGWLLIHWMTPFLTIGHLLLALGITVYIHIALIFEERDLTKEFGGQYLNYKETTPRLNPLLYPFKRNRKAMKIIKIAVFLASVAFIGYGYQFVKWVGHEMDKMKSDDPLIWQDEISSLSQKNSFMKEDTTAVLFVGSSSFRFWNTIDEDLAPIKVVNNGFGGAKLPDVLHFKEELIFRYNPKAIVFFLGSNDISGNNNDKSPEEVYRYYETLALNVHQKHPDSHIYILPITPTLARWDVWPQIREVNEIIRSHSQNVDWVTFIDVEDDFFTESGNLKWKYYKWDGTHLSHSGYKVWSAALKAELSVHSYLTEKSTQ